MIPNPNFFVAGGTLRADAPSYIERQADIELLDIVTRGELCYVLNTRQMGKSSLLVRTIARLREMDTPIRTVIIDLTSIGTTTVDQWYFSLIDEIAYQFDLTAALQHGLAAWWQDHAELACVTRFTQFLRDIVLASIPERIVIFIDEVDSVIPYEFSDDFFRAIRALHNQQATTPAFERLAFVLSGTVAPHDLMKDKTGTPFNIGHRIMLHDLKECDAQVMYQGLPPAYSETILERIFHWTNGHPYLTQKVGQAVAQHENETWTDEQVDMLVHELFLTDGAIVQESNLQFVRNRIVSSSQKGRLLELYRRIIQGSAEVYDEQSDFHNELRLSGLVRVTAEGVLVVRNRIYEQAFDLDWINVHQPANWWRAGAIGITCLSILIVSVLTYYLWLIPKPAEVLADSYVDSFNSTSDLILQSASLADLFALPGYENRALELFLSLNRQDQEAVHNRLPTDFAFQLRTMLANRFDNALGSIQEEDFKGALADLEVVAKSNVIPGEQIVTTILGESRLMAELEQADTNFPELVALLPRTTTCSQTPLRPSETIYCQFTSGLRQDTGRQEITLSHLPSGKYVISLQNMALDHSGAWIIFDHIVLETSNRTETIFEIGRQDTPPDYSSNALC